MLAEALCTGAAKTQGLNLFAQDWQSYVGGKSLIDAEGVCACVRACVCVCVCVCVRACVGACARLPGPLLLCLESERRREREREESLLPCQVRPEGGVRVQDQTLDPS